MATEESRRGPNRRKAYDPTLHCGAPVNRDPADLRDAIEKAKVRLETLRQKEEEGNLGRNDNYRIGHLVKSINWRQKVLAQIEEWPDDRPCVKPKGQGTDHPGEGKCRFHCECKGRDGGHLSYYSRSSRDKRLQTLMDEMYASGEELLNLEPDVVLMRAKIKLFIEDKPDFDPETVRSLTLLVEMLRRLIDSISDTKFKSMISLDLFNVLQARMGEAVADIVQDPDLIDRIMTRWARINVDASERKTQKMIAGTKRQDS